MNLTQLDKNFTEVQHKNILYYFSYSTLVGFDIDGETYVSENVWSSTTGNHLNKIEPDKSKRLSNDEFNKKVEELLK